MRRGSEWHAWLAPGNQTTCNKAAGDAAHLVERKERKAGKEWGTERCKAMGQWSTQISCGDPVVVPVFLFELQIQLRLPIRFTTHGVVCDWVAKRALRGRNLATVVRRPLIPASKWVEGSQGREGEGWQLAIPIPVEANEMSTPL